jgi:hypothetical protein
MYQVHYSKKNQDKNEKITHSGFCSVRMVACVYLHFWRKKMLKKWCKPRQREREREGTELRESERKH